MPDPRKTGISSITGKMVSIRHATSSDLVAVEERLRGHDADSGLENAEVVVAAEDSLIIGFGILKKRDDEGFVSVFEDSRRKGIGSSIVRHLKEYATVKKVHRGRFVSYLTHSGLARVNAIRAIRAAQSRKNRAAYQKTAGSRG